MNHNAQPRPQYLCLLIISVGVFLMPAHGLALELTLDDAVQIALEKSSRGEIIDGDLEVAEQNYFAEKVNFYIPEISINGNLPVYNVAESFRFFGGLDQKQLVRTTDRDLRTNIELRQSLVTGGNVTALANLWNRKSEYPLSGTNVIETSNQGVFDFTFQQPLLKPSDPKNTLNNKRDDLEIARVTKVEEIAGLRKEVSEAYFGVLQTELQMKISNDKAESARLTGDIDSMKFVDGVISEEAWLESTSSRLDAELTVFDTQNEQIEKNRELALLLDLSLTEDLKTSVPEIPEHLTEGQKKFLINQWEESVPVKKAYHEYRKAKRQADYTASSHGLGGTFEANASLGRGDVEVDGVTTDNNTNSWGLAVNFTLPLWDGGSTGASIKAARISEQKSELEYQRARKSVRAEIVALVNRLDVSFRKLNVMQKQIEIAQNKLEIARYRMDDGQISKPEYLDSKVFYLEAQNKYLEELKNYFTIRIDIESKYAN